MGLIAPAFRPPDVLPFEHLVLAAVGTWHEPLALIGFGIGGLDAGKAGRGGCRDHQDLAPAPEGDRGALGQRHRVALAVGIGRIGVDLVEQDVPRRQAAQAQRRVGADHHQLAADEGFPRGAVAAVARPEGHDQAAQNGRVFDQGIDSRRRVAPDHLGRRHDQHDVGRDLVDGVADEVQRAFGAADLGGLHDHDAVDARGRHQAIHDLAQERQAAGAPRAGFGARRRQHSVRVSPLADAEREVGRDAAAP